MYLCYNNNTVLGGEAAVPCTRNPLQRGWIPSLGSCAVKQPWASGVDVRVPRNGNSWTLSGPEGSSSKWDLSCAAGEPGPSQLLMKRSWCLDRRKVHGAYLWLSIGISMSRRQVVTFYFI